jgi:hypothetical protein
LLAISTTRLFAVIGKRSTIWSVYDLAWASQLSENEAKYR